ncbi:uncharacterized protein LOC124939570 [Impatiens glandulifera]|uniref:uncharacterized protein LOC124939570 n=1 Tax=Impatiens glandulifera TaxID=253017 RepID=UPI001FB0D138|nr:uncharacterized protein LOC124939570 [Impatiens glandulifera]
MIFQQYLDIDRGEKCMFPVPSICLRTDDERLAIQKWTVRSALQHLRVTHVFSLLSVLLSLYEEGRFCDAFHQHQDGWRNCESCQKAIHCGCIASFKQFMPSDSCGIICRKCSELSIIMARRSNLLVAATPSPSLVDANQEEMKMIGKMCTGSVVIPLFEKQLSAIDADQRLGRLVIPTKFAEV